MRGLADVASNPTIGHKSARSPPAIRPDRRPSLEPVQPLCRRARGLPPRPPPVRADPGPSRPDARGLQGLPGRRPRLPDAGDDRAGRLARALLPALSLEEAGLRGGL